MLLKSEVNEGWYVVNNNDLDISLKTTFCSFNFWNKVLNCAKPKLRFPCTSFALVAWMEKILLSNDVMLVVDESTRIKTPGAKRTKLITKFGKQVKYKRILTGSPVTQSVLFLT